MIKKLNLSPSLGRSAQHIGRFGRRVARQLVEYATADKSRYKGESRIFPSFTDPVSLDNILQRLAKFVLIQSMSREAGLKFWAACQPKHERRYYVEGNLQNQKVVNVYSDLLSVYPQQLQGSIGTFLWFLSSSSLTSVQKYDSASNSFRRQGNGGGKRHSAMIVRGTQRGRLGYLIGTGRVQGIYNGDDDWPTYIAFQKPCLSGNPKKMGLTRRNSTGSSASVAVGPSA